MAEISSALLQVRKMADEMDLDFRDQIISWESKYQEVNLLF